MMYRFQFSVFILFRIRVLLDDWTIYPTTQCHGEEDVNFQEYRMFFGWFRGRSFGGPEPVKCMLSNTHSSVYTH